MVRLHGVVADILRAHLAVAQLADAAPLVAIPEVQPLSTRPIAIALGLVAVDQQALGGVGDVIQEPGVPARYQKAALCRGNVQRRTGVGDIGADDHRAGLGADRGEVAGVRQQELLQTLVAGVADP